ncbi:SHOCT domain-containing protein [Aldersonia kunmingensis]|uniref:SHOCT domain-containing protein n=1 Tax=Aldersonia kunmingensis TaxID=408066 RepID=UPI001FE19617|nr:SHOCT domain-containing protein [Aldersonia kunmingensis]
MVDDQATSGLAGIASRVKTATEDFARRASAESAALDGSPDVLWSAKGQPLTGIGGGRYRLTSTTLFFESGTLTTNAQQVPTNQLFDIDLRQTITQKARNVGDVVVHVQRATGVEVVVLNDVPNPREAVNVINEAAAQARYVAHTLANTRHVTSNAAPVAPVHTAPAQPARPAAVETDVIAQITRLGELRDSGILTEDEFAQKKAELLARV